ncbi:IS66 family transposase [Candidatus Nomurabacteria bacterium]|nr:IS66 family transposase [Lewinellaceae bacterium]MCB9811274.1 IS66 family transposase [Candidatus Nomurabacteria bacterium]
MPNPAIPYIKWDKLRLIYRIKALEAYVRSLEKAFRPPVNAEPAVVYMDKEKEELIKQLLRDRLLEEMGKLLGELKEENQNLHGQLEEAKKAEEVLRKPKKDSKTSSQPPSQDNKAKVTKSSGWGAKPGHQGFSYQPLPWDKVLVVPLSTCPHTGADLSQQPVVDYITHQVVSIECKRVVTNYELEVRFSPAYGGMVSAAPPNGGRHYDNSVRSLATYLNTVHHIPQGRCRQILQDLFSIAPSKGTVNNILIRPPQLSKAIHQSLIHRLRLSPVVGADETGYRVKGEGWYLWCFQSPDYSLFTFADTRASSVVDDILGKVFKGVLVSDFYAGYSPANISKQKCNAHLIRDLKYVILAEPKSAAFARDVITMLLDAKKLADNDQREDKWVKQAKARLKKLIEKKLPEKQEEAIKIQNRLKKHKEEILLFLENPAVPFTNNATERAIRPVVVHRKVIQCFRTEHGAQAFATWYSLIDTFRKQGINVFEALKGIFDGIIPQLNFPQLE